MKHAIVYKESKEHKKPIGFIELNKGLYTFKLVINNSQPRHRKLLEEIYNDVLKIFSKHYRIVNISSRKQCKTSS